MAESIGVAASILAIIHLGKAIYNGLKDIQDAPAAIDNVKLEIFHLHNYLQRLRDLVHMPSSPLSYLPGESQDGLKGSLQCLKTVEEQLLDALKSYLTQKNRMGVFFRQVKWVLGKEKDVEKLRRNLEAHKTTLTATVSLLQFLAIGKVIEVRGKFQQACSVPAGGYGAPLELLERPLSANILDFNDLPDLEGIKQILQVSSRDFEFDDEQEKDHFWKTQRYKDSLAEFVNSGKFDQALAYINSQRNIQEVPVIDYNHHSAPVPQGYHNPTMTHTWGTYESSGVATGEYDQHAPARRYTDPAYSCTDQSFGGNNYPASGYHINQQPTTPPQTPPDQGNYWEPPPPQPVDHAGFVSSTPPRYSSPLEGPPTTTHTFHPQDPRYAPPLLGNGWEPTPDATYPNETHNMNHCGSQYTGSGPDWQPYTAPPPEWGANFHVPQSMYTYPPDSLHADDQPGYGYEWNGSSGNGYS